MLPTTFTQSTVSWNISSIARLSTCAVPVATPSASIRTVKLNVRSSPATMVCPDPVAEATIPTPAPRTGSARPDRAIVNVAVANKAREPCVEFLMNGDIRCSL
jgi:hypothetical protein